MPTETAGMSVVTFDFQGLLAALNPGTQKRAWHEEDGPESGCGIDYWYNHWALGLHYINVDQGEVKISNCDTDEVLFEGDLASSEEFGKFVTTS